MREIDLNDPKRLVDVANAIRDITHLDQRTCFIAAQSVLFYRVVGYNRDGNIKIFPVDNKKPI